MLPAMNPELQKIAKPTRTIIVRPRRPIFGILDGVGRPTERGMFNSLIRSLMLGFQYARKKNRGITIGSRFCILPRTRDTCSVPSRAATFLSNSNSCLFRDFLGDLRIQSAESRNIGLGRTITVPDSPPAAAAGM